jgi:replicative DNA helicase
MNRYRTLHDHRMEEVWLATLLRNPDRISQVLSIIDKPELLDKPTHSALWRSMIELYRAGHSVDPASLTTHVTTNGYLADDQAESLISILVPLGGSAQNIETWTSQLIELYQWRDSKMMAADIEAWAIDPTIAFEEVVSKIAARLAGVQGTSRPHEVGAVADSMLKEMQQAQASGTVSLGLLTGFYELDNATGGLEDDDFFGIAARPRVGKTSAALQMIRNILLSQEEGIVPFYSLEMSPERLVRRNVAALSGVPYGLIRSNRLTEEQYNRVVASYAIMQAWKDRLLIFTSRNFAGGPSADKIIQSIEGLSMRYNVITSVTDNFQRLPYKDRHDLNAISRAFKDMTGTVMHPHMMLLQLNRATEKDNREPKLADIKETGQLEQDLDRVVLVDRADLRNSSFQEHWDEMGIVENLSTWDLAKNRDGGPAYFQQMFDGETMQFLPWEGAHTYTDSVISL